MISSVGLSSATLTVSSLQQTTSSPASSAAGASSGTSATGDSSHISGPGKLFSALKELASTDPTKFKQVAADIAAKLKDAAGQSGTDGTNATDGTSAAAGSGNSRLADLAAKFQQAADTGDVSVLQPPSGGGHPHPHSGGVGHYNQQGQVTPSSDASNKENMKALFDSITQEVTSALGS